MTQWKRWLMTQWKGLKRWVPLDCRYTELCYYYETVIVFNIKYEQKIRLAIVNAHTDRTRIFYRTCEMKQYIANERIVFCDSVIGHACQNIVNPRSEERVHGTTREL